jgi:hypothetical protein
MDDMDVRIGEVVTDVTVTDGPGPLSAEDMKTLVAKVLEQVRQAQDRQAERDADTRIHDRAFRK